MKDKPAFRSYFCLPGADRGYPAYQLPKTNIEIVDKALTNVVYLPPQKFIVQMSNVKGFGGKRVWLHFDVGSGNLQ